MANTTKTSRGTARVFGGLSLIGGHPGLDFLNTVKYRGEVDSGDTLKSFADVITWAQISGLITANEAASLSRQVEDGKSVMRIHREICALRERVRIVFAGAAAQDARYARAISQVENAISALRPTATIDKRSGVLSQRIEIKTSRDLKARIISAIAELLSHRENVLIKTCGGSGCDWLFIDRTKAKRRQWCDTRTCGNAARVRRHRLKH